MQRANRWVLVFGCIGSLVPCARAQSLGPVDQLARDIFKQLIEINTTDSAGNVTTAAEAMAQRLRNAASSAKSCGSSRAFGETPRQRISHIHSAASVWVSVACTEWWLVDKSSANCCGVSRETTSNI